LCLAILFIITVGPWPTYGKIDLEKAGFYKKAIRSLSASADRIPKDTHLPEFSAGWACIPIELPPGLPLAGFESRKGKPSEGQISRISVKAVVFNDGRNRAALVSADLLLIPEITAETVRKKVSSAFNIPEDAVLFNATHTHSGPGAFHPGLVSRIAAGPFNKKWTNYLTGCFLEALDKAVAALQPAEMAVKKLKARGLIVNRVRPGGPVDDDLQIMAIKTKQGRRCTIVGFAAHATLLSAKNMKYCGDYPGYVQSSLKSSMGGEVIFLATAVGSMKPGAPQNINEVERAQHYADSLAVIIRNGMQDLDFTSRVSVATLGGVVTMPAFQVRLNRHFRLSPYLLPILGIDNRSWIQAVRLGLTVMVGYPGELCGEISPGLKEWGRSLGYDLWTLSFNGDYIGYVSPDRYYNKKNMTGGEKYELISMSWCGPQQEEYLIRLTKHMVQKIGEE